MEKKEITVESLLYNSWLRYAKGCTIAFVICLLLCGISMLAIYLTMGFNDLMFLPLGIFGMGAGVLFYIIIIFLFIALSKRKKVNEYLDAYGEEQVLSALNNPVHTFNYKNKPYTFFTEKFIYDQSFGFINMDDVDVVYGYRYNNATYLRVLTLQERTINICAGIGINTQASKDAMNALYRIKPSILFGYVSDNFAAHKEHVKEYKKQNR